MLKKRIIPKLLIQTQKIGSKEMPVAVTSKNFNFYRNVGNPISQAKIFQDQLADELLILSLDNKIISENIIMKNTIEKLSSNIFMPIIVGGGVRKLDHFDILLKIGADKIVINSQAIEDPKFISTAAKHFGSQCVVVSVDFVESNGKFLIYQKFKNKITNIEVETWAKQISELGCGEIILCDVDRDGSGSGLNLNLSKIISQKSKVPIILSGGCGLAKHFIEGFKIGMADGVSAGTFFSYRDQNLIQVRNQAINSGVNLRTII